MREIAVDTRESGPSIFVICRTLVSGNSDLDPDRLQLAVQRPSSLNATSLTGDGRIAVRPCPAVAPCTNRTFKRDELPTFGH
jgi:hypothetical protein